MVLFGSLKMTFRSDKSKIDKTNIRQLRLFEKILAELENTVYHNPIFVTQIFLQLFGISGFPEEVQHIGVTHTQPEAI